ncbi:putative zinc finger, CCHC-type containing protein [Tanacetum coccineum]
MPLVNPYQIFTKPTSSITKRVQQLIGSAPNKQIKEFVQTFKFDSHQLPASQVEHLVSLSLPSDHPRHCLAQGYTHINFGAIMLALTFHGRKGLPVYSRMALLDTSQDNAGDALMIDVDSNATPTCTYVPRQLFREELVKSVAEKWITNYEQIHQAPVRSTSAPEFVRHENGLVEIKFSSSQPNCLDEAAKIDDDDDEDLPKKRKYSQQILKIRHEKGDPIVGLLREPSGKFDYYVLYPKAEPSQPPSPPHKTPPSPHKTPPTITSPPPPKLSPYNQKALSILHQDSPVFLITKDPSCSYLQEYEKEFQPHCILNTSENVVAQNKVLVKILSQQSMITNSQEYLSSRVRSLESIINELRFKIQELHREIIQIIRTSPTTQPSSSISQKEAEMKNLKNQLQDLERQHKQKRITSLIDDPWRLPSTPFVGFSFDPQPLPQSYTNITSPSLNIWASEQRKLKPSTRKEPTFSQESQSIADVVASTKTPDVLPIQKYYTIDVVIKRFLTRLQGRLRDWYHRIGEYRQLQIQKSISPEAFMSIIYLEFIGSPLEHTTHAREEFLKTKLDDVNLNQVFLNSFLEFLGNEAYRALEERNVTIAQTTLGELYLLILNALAKLCNQKKFLAEFERIGKRLGTACDDKYLQIKCKDKSSCDCTDIKKKFHSKRFSSLSSKPRFSRQSCKKWKFIRKKKQRGITSDRCFICQKRGHFVRSCPDKKRSQELIQALNQVEPVDVSDLESFYSLDDEPSDSILCTIAYLDFSSDDDSDSDSLESYSDFGVHMINPISYVLPIQENPPLPLAKIHLLKDAYAKPILVIAFFDIGSSVSILNTNILPDHYWKPHHQNFMAANGEKFVIDKISVPINIRLFPKCVIKRRLLGEGLHYRSFFNPWTTMHRLFIDEQSHAELLSKFYSLVAKYGIMLSEKNMEVRNPPEWTSRQTKAVKGIKCLAEKMPPLKILASSEKRILQTDASDECWGAVLLVQDNNNKRHVCGYKSGTFKVSEQHYHSTFKEILVVKEGIEKFQFHLIGHEFHVKTDMSSFLRMLQFKRKILPHAQLLRRSNWFLQWKFIVKHIKGTKNILADFLSHPKAYKLEKKYLKDARRVQKHTPHFLLMVFSITSHKEEGYSSNPTPTIPVFDLQEGIVEMIGDFTFEKRAKLCYKTFFTILLKNHGLWVKGLRAVAGYMIPEFPKGLPAYSRIALLDTRFVEYQHACIGTIQTTLNAGTIFVIFYLNFNMPLNDPSLLTALKAQIQIGGTPQVNTFQATFHYQMAYRVQNHSLDILVPGQDNAGDALLIDVDSNATPTCTYVPRQLSRDELVKLLLEKWITNYEQIHQAPVRSTSAPEFEPAQEVKHIWWDVCNCESCLDEAAKIDDDEDLPKKRKSSQQKLKRRYEKGDPAVGLLGERKI